MGELGAGARFYPLLKQIVIHRYKVVLCPYFCYKVILPNTIYPVFGTVNLTNMISQITFVWSLCLDATYKAGEVTFPAIWEVLLAKNSRYATRQPNVALR